MSIIRDVRNVERQVERLKTVETPTMGSAWDGAHIVMGVYHLWVDATGDLRIKSSAPANDTDGAVVGSQS